MSILKKKNGEDQLWTTQQRGEFHGRLGTRDDRQKGGEHDWNLVQQMRKAVDSVVTVNCK